ncbi:MAG: hypothetical protein IIC81_03650, partial [Chloroflexi bacterium]|nr:hypothetical protein [Chloroflexota bacterium]
MKKVYALGAVLVATLALFACSGQGSPQMDQTASLKPEPTPTATPRSQNSEIVIPVAPKVVDYHGTWNPVMDFDPFTIPVEKGFYNGTTNNMGWGATETPEGRAYALKVYPDLADSIDDDVRTGTLADLTSTASTATVTSVSTLFGTRGNAVTLTSSSGSRLAVSASTFASGANEFTIDVNDSGTTIFSG